ncbi:MAG: MucR family transcriptional regulator [Sphingomonas fennica]
MADENGGDLLTLTADIVAAHVSNNSVAVGDVPQLIEKVYASLQGLGTPQEEPVAELKPAVPVRSSVKPDYIVCLEDGKKLTMLKRYLRTNYGMSPEDYRAKWSLPADYPMVAPNYAAKRRDLAHSIGLGRKRKDDAAGVEAEVMDEAPAPEAKPATRKRAPKKADA